MAEVQSRVRLSFLVALLVGIAVVAMVAERRAHQRGRRDIPVWVGPLLDLAVPLQKALAWPIDSARRIGSNYVALLGVREENEALRARLARLDEENLQLREALVASGHLERIAEMRKDFEMPMLPAALVGRDVSPWFHAALLDRGRSDGVRAGMPVVADAGLAGLVVATSHGASKAMLLLDRQMAIDGTVQRSRTHGIVRGRGSAVLEFEFVAREADVRVGDRILSSGLGGVYPKGIRIGEVRELLGSADGLLGRARVEPAVDFGRLEQVFVLLWRGPVMELLYSEKTGDLGDAAGAAAEGP